MKLCSSSAIGAWGPGAVAVAIVLTMFSGTSTFAQTASPDPFEGLSGWYRFEEAEFDCNDTDNQMRVAIGRYLQDENYNITFGQGAAKVGMYESTCQMDNPVFYEGKIQGETVCTYGDGETVTGFVSITESSGNVHLSTPLFEGRLIGCGVSTEIAEQSANQPVTSGPPAAAGPSDFGWATAMVAPALQRSPKSQAQKDAATAAYASNCDPNFLNQSGWPPINADPTFVEQYRNQLIISYKSNCAAFYADEVSTQILQWELEASRPEMFRLPGSRLNDQMAILVGMNLFLSRPACEPILAEMKDSVSFAAQRGLLAHLEALAGEADRDLAIYGYGGAIMFNTNLQAGSPKDLCIAAYPIAVRILDTLRNAGLIR